MNAKLLYVHALSPLHAGTGQGLGVIDLPIAREKATQIPFLPGSSLKGVFRDACADSSIRVKVFGPDSNNADLHAGAVAFTDARLLLLPVRSLRGVFAWVTSPLLLRRLKRDALEVEGFQLPKDVPVPAQEDECMVIEQSSALLMSAGGSQKVILEDLALNSTPSAEVTDWAEKLGEAIFPQSQEWRQALQERLCVVSDDLLSFLLETATEITARICLKEDEKTVAEGALWYEEALPCETVLVALVAATTTERVNSDEVFQTVKELAEKTLQFGGNATVGRGLCRITLV